ncbi:hypothetical protein F5Y15DRAFT_158760 [Xylariaceae sp. FL0016]|nr:hypothetical protein F5Y15DRAFT_158760 [Xylariaceae sp. FL0016]
MAKTIPYLTSMMMMLLLLLKLRCHFVCPSTQSGVLQMDLPVPVIAYLTLGCESSLSAAPSRMFAEDKSNRPNLLAEPLAAIVCCRRFPT